MSLGAAVDYLYGLAQQAATGVTVNDEPVLVVDGEPDLVAFGMFVVGMSEPPPDLAGDITIARDWEGLPARYLVEDYTVPCYIDVRVPGGEQKTARDLAESLFNAFWALVKADLTLGGLLQGGRSAAISEVTSTSSNVGSAAEKGRRQLIRFGVHAQNLTT